MELAEGHSLVRESMFVLCCGIEGDTKSNHPHHQVRSCGSRRFLAAASYDSNAWPHNLGNVGGGVVLDFKSFAVHLPSAEEESGDFVVGAGRRKRDCNVEPMASGDRVYPNFVWPYNCSDPFEASIRTQTHSHLEPSYVVQISSFELGHNGVRVVLDFKSLVVPLPSTNGGMQPMSLCNDTRSYRLCVDFASQKRRKTVHTRQPTSVGSQDQ
nr:hypothetical protein [Tanacetum cinerariifolium]